MKYSKLPKLMWLIFKPSFQRELYRMTEEDVIHKAKKRYMEILSQIPEFDKDDRFLVNILSAAMLASIYLELENKPSLDQVTDFYHHAMTDNVIMKLFLKKKSTYTKKAQDKLAAQAKASLARTNPYSWKFDYISGKDVNSYTAIFHTCGIKHLFETLHIPEITPAMCSYDYDMAELAGSIFTREYTLAGHGPYCDCHYQNRKEFKS